MRLNDIVGQDRLRSRRGALKATREFGVGLQVPAMVLATLLSGTTMLWPDAIETSASGHSLSRLTAIRYPVIAPEPDQAKPSM